MTVEEAVRFGDFLQRCTLQLSMRPRTASGKLIMCRTSWRPAIFTRWWTNTRKSAGGS